jgi:uncharacterized membrane-anchored protein
MVSKVSVNKKTILLIAAIFVILVAAGLILYSMVNARDYDGIFVNGVRQVLL